MNKKKQREIRIYVSQNSNRNHKNYWITFLLNYILDKGLVYRNNPREIILEALQAFWLPLVCIHQKGITNQEIENIYGQSISKLENQILFLKEELKRIKEDGVKDINDLSNEKNIDEKDNQYSNHYDVTGML